MKIRNGFVSNSSSSSFVVAFPKRPKNAKAVKKMLFDEHQEWYPSPFANMYKDGDTRWSIDQVVEIVMSDIVNQDGTASLDKVKEDIGSGYPYYEGENPDIGYNIGVIKSLDDKHFGMRDPIDWTAYDHETGVCEEKIAKAFMRENQNAHIYIFEYSDNDSRLFCAMEHGSLFNKVEHIAISKH